MQSKGGRDKTRHADKQLPLNSVAQLQTTITDWLTSCSSLVGTIAEERGKQVVVTLQVRLTGECGGRRVVILVVGRIVITRGHVCTDMR